MSVPSSVSTYSADDEGYMTTPSSTYSESPPLCHRFTHIALAPKTEEQDIWADAAEAHAACDAENEPVYISPYGMGFSVGVNDAKRAAARLSFSATYEAKKYQFNRDVCADEGFIADVRGTTPPIGLFNFSKFSVKGEAQLAWLHAHRIFPTHTFYDMWLLKRFATQ